MIGISSSFLQNPREEDISQRVFEVAEEYGLDVEEELDRVGVKYLGSYVNARTSSQGAVIRIDFDSQNFFEKSKPEQKRIILHELIHVKQFENSLSDWTKNQFDVSEEFAEKLDGTIWEDVKSVEGETEMILGNMFPEMGSSYPYAQDSKQREMEGLGINVESELTVEAEHALAEVVENYRQVDESWEGENIYIEEGSVQGINYEVAVTGYGEDPEEAVESYIEERLEEYIPPEEREGIGGMDEPLEPVEEYAV